MTKTILVPTDFSESSWVAIQYAARHAKAIHAHLKIIHIYQSFYSAFAGEQFNEEISAHTVDVANKQMSALLSKLKSKQPSVAATGECIEGVLRITIEELLKKEKYDLIVMGTSGASGIKSIVGSNTLDIINISTVPVLAVPEEANKEEFNKVGLLTNFKEEEISILQKATNILPPLSLITLLHIRENHDESEEVMLDKWKEIIEEKLPSIVIERKIGLGDNITSTIDTMIESEKTDLLIVTNNERSFFKTLFSRNLVRSIALSPQIPILFIKPDYESR